MEVHLPGIFWTWVQSSVPQKQQQQKPNTSSGIEINKTAEMANLQNAGLIHCQSERFQTTLGDLRGTTHKRTDAVVGIVMTMGTEGKLFLLFLSFFWIMFSI